MLGTPSCARSSPGQSEHGTALVPSQGKQREEKIERNEIRQKQQEMKEMNQMGEGAGEQSHDGDFAPRSPVMNEALMEFMISQAPLAGCSLDLLPPRAAPRSHGCWRRWDPARASRSQQPAVPNPPRRRPLLHAEAENPFAGAARTGPAPCRTRGQQRQDFFPKGAPMPTWGRPAWPRDVGRCTMAQGGFCCAQQLF